jgi:hypothetical protein
MLLQEYPPEGNKWLLLLMNNRLYRCAHEIRENNSAAAYTEKSDM